MKSAVQVLKKRVLLLYGIQKVLKERLLQELEKKIIATDFSRDFNMNIFYGGDTALSEIIDTANTLPVMADRRLVIVHDFDKVSRFQEILHYYNPPCEETLLVLDSENQDFFRKFDKPFLKKFEKTYGEFGEVLKFYPPGRKELAAYAGEEFSAHGKQVSNKSLAFLVDRTGENLSELINEITKIVAFSGKKKEISLEEIDQIVSESTDSSLEKIRDAVLTRRPVTALRAFYNFFQRKEPLILLAWDLARTFRDLLQAAYLMNEKGYSRDQIQKEFRLYHFKVRDIFFAGLNAYSFEELKKIPSVFHKLDKIMKSARGEYTRVYFERVLIALCKRRNRSPA